MRMPFSLYLANSACCESLCVNLCVSLILGNCILFPLGFLKLIMRLKIVLVYQPFVFFLFLLKMCVKVLGTVACDSCYVRYDYYSFFKGFKTFLEIIRLIFSPSAFKNSQFNPFSSGLFLAYFLAAHSGLEWHIMEGVQVRCRLCLP